MSELGVWPCVVSLMVGGGGGGVVSELGAWAVCCVSDGRWRQWMSSVRAWCVAVCCRV